MAFYNAANLILDSLNTNKISGKELLQSYVMSLFDMEREATIVYDFLEREGYLDKGMYMAITDRGSYDPNDMPNFYVIIPHSVVVGKHNFILNFWDKWKALAKENNFHFLLKAGEDMLIQGKELVTSTYTILKWKPMKKKTREHFGDILSGLNEEITTGDIESSARAHERLKRGTVSDHVIIFFTYYQWLIGNKNSKEQNVYIFKPISKLTNKEKEIYKILVTKHKIDSGYTDKFGVSVFLCSGVEMPLVPNLEFISMYKGDKRDLEAFLKHYLEVNKKENYVEKQPIMGKKAQSHFGDIIDNL